MRDPVVLVLGPIEVAVDGERVAVGGKKTRAVLTALVLDLGHAVSSDHLIAAVWRDDPPASARTTLQSRISRLRNLTGAESIVFEDDAYTLDVPPQVVDVVQFEQLANSAAACVDNDPDAAAEQSAAALALWRGRPFGDLADDEFVVPATQRLEQLRLWAMETRLWADVVRGEYGHVIPTLQAAVADHPYRERLWMMLMTALACDGRRVEALRAYSELDALLAELGLEPGQELRDLEQQILVEDPKLIPCPGGE